MPENLSTKQPILSNQIMRIHETSFGAAFAQGDT
jgi:hypothetical protein